MMKHLTVHGINSVFDCKRTEPVQSSSTQHFPSSGPSSTCPPQEYSSITDDDEDSGAMTEDPTGKQTYKIG